MGANGGQRQPHSVWARWRKPMDLEQTSAMLATDDNVLLQMMLKANEGVKMLTIGSPCICGPGSNRFHPWRLEHEDEVQTSTLCTYKHL